MATLDAVWYIPASPTGTASRIHGKKQKQAISFSAIKEPHLRYSFFYPYISMKLDENERSTQTRLMKVKDMMLEQTHHYREKNEEKYAAG